MADFETQIALGIVLDENTALVIERKQREVGNNGLPIVWAFPGGKLEDSETPELAAVREVEEETGYLVEALEIITSENHQQFPVYVHYVACRLIGKSTLAETPLAIVGTLWSPAASLDQLFTSPMNTKVRAYIQSHI